MAERPVSYPFWVFSGPNVVQPASELAATGWDPGQAPDAENINWMFGDINAWIEYLDQITATGAPSNAIRLINGGLWSFNASTGVMAWSLDANLAIPGVPDSANDIPAGSVTLADGDIAYLNANVPTFSTGNTDPVNNPDQIFNMNFTANITSGMVVTGPGIANGTTVLSVGANFVVLSQNTTAVETDQQYTFATNGPLSVQVAPNTSVEPTPSTILLARRAGNVVYLGVNCAQMVLRDGEFKTLSGSGYFSIYNANAGQALTAGTLVYISPGSSDGGRTQGALYPLDVSGTNQAVRGTYAGVVITSVGSGQQATILYSGFFAESGLIAGATYYADPSNPGGFTPNQPNSAGARIEPIGFAVTTSIMLFTGTESSPGNIGFPVFNEDDFVGNGTRTAFPLSQTALNGSAVFVFADGNIVPNSQWGFASNTVTFTAAPAVGVGIEIRYILAAQQYLAGGQETPTNPSSDHQTFVLTGIPVNQSSTFVFVDGGILPSSAWALEVGGGAAKVILNGPIAPGQDIYVAYFTSAASIGGGGGGGLTGGANIGSGVGVYSGISGSVFQLKSLVAGTNVTLVDNGTSITINATGGGGSIQANGNFAVPLQFSPSAGLTPNNVNDQVWFVAPLSGGATPVTANPQIAAGTTVGQRLTIKGTSAVNYYTFQDGNGLSLNGALSLTNNQSCELMWDGSQWNENTRRM